MLPLIGISSIVIRCVCQRAAIPDHFCIVPRWPTSSYLSGCPKHPPHFYALIRLGSFTLRSMPSRAHLSMARIVTPRRFATSRRRRIRGPARIVGFSFGCCPPLRSSTSSRLRSAGVSVSSFLKVVLMISNVDDCIANLSVIHLIRALVLDTSSSRLLRSYFAPHGLFTGFLIGSCSP